MTWKGEILQKTCPDHISPQNQIEKINYILHKELESYFWDQGLFIFLLFIVIIVI